MLVRPWVCWVHHEGAIDPVSLDAAAIRDVFVVS